jgi:DNA-binding response OmpR family regulator
MSRERSWVAVVIEDDPDVRELIDVVLSQAGFTTVLTSSGEEGVEAVRAHNPLLTTVDVQMPGMDGFETTRAIRDISDTYLIMVTALTDEESVITGFTAGADDYLGKPFRARELWARAESMLRRPRSRSAEALVPRPGAGAPLAAVAPASDEVIVQWKGVRLQESTRSAHLDGEELELTRTEFDLLISLITTGRRVRSKADLVLVSRGERNRSSHVSESDKRSVEVHIANVRRKLGDDATAPRYLETVRGLGYRMAAPPQSH